MIRFTRTLLFFGMRLQAKRDTALDSWTGSIQSAVAAALCRRTPNSLLTVWILHHRDVRQIPITFSVIKTVADDELVRNLKTEVINRHFFLAPFKLIQQCRQLH